MEAGGVDEVDHAAAQQHIPGDHVPGGAGNGGDNGAILAQQGIEQAALAHVGAAAQGHGEAAGDDAGSLFVAGVFNGISQLLDAGQQVAGGFLFADLLRIVDAGGGSGLDGVKLVGGLPDEAAGTALQLVHGGLVGAVTLGGDEGHHRLGLAEVDAAVEEGAAGEFAGLGKPCAALQALFQHPLAGVAAAVELQLGHVLAGVAAGRAHENGHALVDGLVAVHHVAVGEHMALEGRCLGRAKHPQQHLLGLGAGNAHDAHTALSRRGGNGGNGVMGHSSSSSSFFQ